MRKTVCDECANKEHDLPNGICACKLVGDTIKVHMAPYDEVVWEACNCYQEKREA